jgi:hypothetical protein
MAVFSLRDPGPSLTSLDRLLGRRRPSRVGRQVEVPSLAPVPATPARDDSPALPESAALSEAAPQSAVAAVVASPVVASAIVPAGIAATRGAPAGGPSILSSGSVSEGSATS